MKNRQKVLQVLVCLSILSSILFIPIQSAQAKSFLSDNKLESVKPENQFLTKPLLRDGDLDPTYGDNGVLLNPLNCTNLYVEDADITYDGKMVVTGSCGSQVFIARFNDTGLLDTTFAGVGYVRFSVSGYTGSSPLKIYVDYDNSIFVTGVSNSNNRAFIANYNTDGTRDISFGSQGLFSYFFGVTIGMLDINGYNDGRIILSAGGNRIEMIRLYSNGSRDMTFAGNGEFGLSLIPNTGHHIFDMIVDNTSGDIVAAGQLGGISGRVGVIRLTEQGVLKSDFGENGIAILNPYGNARGIDVQTDGKLLITGWTNPGAVCIRLNPNGTVDTTFADNGYLRLSRDIVFSFGSFQDSMVQSNGDIVIGGSLSGMGFITVKVNTFGKMIDSYGTGGIQQHRIGSTFSGAIATVMQEDGKVIQAGYAGSYDNSILLIRLLNSVIEPIIDLTADNSNYFVTGSWGSMINVSLLINNNGNTDSGSFDVVFYANRDGHLTVLREIGRVRVTNVEQGSVYGIVESFDTTGFGSADFVWASIDDNNEVVELDEENNWIYTTIPKDDLRRL